MLAGKFGWSLGSRDTTLTGGYAREGRNSLAFLGFCYRVRSDLEVLKRGVSALRVKRTHAIR
jgi:hypothetical protein